jgi:hypothetical protein
MRDDAKHLMFGLLVLACYWYVVRNGVVFWSADQSPAGPAAHVSGGAASRSHPTFWSTGFQGGK